ncbi:acyl-CoA mutase large subunit family protein [Paenibacillus thermotolerans]|uniref:acyl-CoA mutase large subunit family protein n=1 Tax=Paenibacillus thermotolerans TaxID=3027807 RepID=UPI002367D025|nr:MULTISPECIES: methylmalonyl-CoA mutase family protein [unclassified Paenibacillus]
MTANEWLPGQHGAVNTRSCGEMDVCYPSGPMDEAQAERIGRPGEFPYTRGIHPHMYRSRLWTMRQYSGFGSPRETNRRLKYLLRKGQTGLSLAFDLPTQLGLDAGDPLAAGEVGKTGVSISSLSDMEKVLKGIPLGDGGSGKDGGVSLSMTINATAGAVLAMVEAVADKAGVDRRALSGTVQNDILKEFAARNAYIFPLEPSLRLAGDVMQHVCESLPRWNAVSVSGYHMREAGATAAQEVGFAFANGIAYIEEALSRGLSVDAVAPRIAFFFASHSHLLEEAAKFRAARRLWARLMRERFGAKEPRSLQLRFHAQTAGSTLTAAQPDNNVVRVTLQALAAVFGGAQSLHTNAKDEALRLPSASAAALALRTQQIIACESGAAETVDPLAGSYAVEALTDAIERSIAACLDAVEREGGAVEAIRRGYMQREIRSAAYRTHREITDGTRPIVGVNRFAGDGAELRSVPSLSRIRRAEQQADAERQRAAELAAARAQRSETDAARALRRLSHDAGRGFNTMPSMHGAVQAGCTVGEIYGTLSGIFGTYRESADEWEVIDE